jgi:hypothetical protein
MKFVKTGKAVTVTGRGGSWVSETSRLPYFLDSRLVDGVEVVNLMRRPPLPPGGFVVYWF